MSGLTSHLPTQAAVRAALKARRSALREAWESTNGGLADGVVLIPAGLVLAVEGSDQHYEFRAHDDHYYASGCRIPGQVLALDPAAGDGEAGWQLFAYEASQEDRVWLGDSPPVEALAEATGIGAVRPVAELGAWLTQRQGLRVPLIGSRDLLERPIGYGLSPGELDALTLDAELSQRLQERVIERRRRKDDVELAFLRAAAAASRAGHNAGMSTARAGTTERALQVEIDAGFLRAGAERPAYTTIAVAGSNCAVLHATPGPRALAAGDLVLVDAGAEVEGYDSDVTRTWPVDRGFTPEQRAIYEIVLAVQEAAIRGARAGVEYRELHMQASRGIAQGLADFGLLKGRADDLVDRDAHALFFPHGLGHLLGLATHDVGGNIAGRERSDRPGLKFLRIDLPLEERFVVTIEPGIYFVRALLEDESLRNRHYEAVNWEMADRMVDFGGVRIEDDVVIGADGADPEVLSAEVPKQIDDVEAVRSLAG